MEEFTLADSFLENSLGLDRPLTTLAESSCNNIEDNGILVTYADLDNNSDYKVIKLLNSENLSIQYEYCNIYVIRNS